MYTARLINKEGCTFDSCYDFDTIQEAIEWSMDRGNEYSIEIGGDDIEFDPSQPKLRCHRKSLFVMVDETGSPYTWMPTKRRYLTVEEAVRLVK